MDVPLGDHRIEQIRLKLFNPFPNAKETIIFFWDLFSSRKFENYNNLIKGTKLCYFWVLFSDGIPAPKIVCQKKIQRKNPKASWYWLKNNFRCFSFVSKKCQQIVFCLMWTRALYMGELRKNTTSTGTITKKPRLLWQV